MHYGQADVIKLALLHVVCRLLAVGQHITDRQTEADRKNISHFTGPTSTPLLSCTLRIAMKSHDTTCT